MDSNELRHVAIIMDGNNRWAKRHHKLMGQGHKAGVEQIREVMRACRDHAVEVLTVFAFSSENWKRPAREVEALMGLFLSYLKHESKKLAQEGVRLKVIGRRDRFSASILKAIEAAEERTKGGSVTLVVAADYGGRWDMANAAAKVAQLVAAGELAPDQVNEELIHRHTCLADLPPPDLLIRTGGDHRISNFLLWQAAYTELYFCETFWPDFGAEDLQKAIQDFHQRQRRFGKTSEQISKEKHHA